ncbi:MAG TPA: CehA/McbA family metallohydrolase [Candidatus Bathyarchaeia archaeon]
MQVKADLHVHTSYSTDSIITPKDLVFYAKKRELTAVAVTDHNQVEGAMKIAAETDFLVIPGTEVSSRDGHIVGLNVNDNIPRGLSAGETVDRIHSTGGVAIACHPYALFKGSIGQNVSSKFDAIETINASSFPFRSASSKAEKLAKRFNLPRVAGTDAHFGPVIGCAYTIIDSELNLEAILGAIIKGKCEPAGGSISMRMRIENQGRFFKKYLGNQG